MEYIPDPFLKDSWEQNAQVGNNKEDKERKILRIWSEIELASIKDVFLKNLFDQVKKDILHYQSTIRAFKEAREDMPEANEVTELKYKNENRAHQRLIADLNLLSRQFIQKGFSVKWREEIGLTDEEVGRWAERLELK